MALCKTHWFSLVQKLRAKTPMSHNSNILFHIYIYIYIRVYRYIHIYIYIVFVWPQRWQNKCLDLDFASRGYRHMNANDKFRIRPQRTQTVVIVSYTGCICMHYICLVPSVCVFSRQLDPTRRCMQWLPPPLCFPLSLHVHIHNTTQHILKGFDCMRTDLLRNMFIECWNSFLSRCVLMLCSGKGVHVRFLSCMISSCVKNIDS